MKKVFYGLIVIFAIVFIVKVIPNGNSQKKEKLVYDKLVVNKTTITSTAKFFPVKIDDVTYEVIVVRGTDGEIRTAFNACQVCSDSGLGHYIQEGDYLVCQNCGNRFHIDQIGKQRGGCNPAPITDSEKIEDEETITIPTTTFIKNKELFRR